MLNLNLTHPRHDGAFRVLCLGAHSDDIEIGCGGTILKLIENSMNVEFFWIVLSARSERRKEALRSASLFLQSAGKKKVVAKSFRESYFPFEADKLKDYFEDVKKTYHPDLVFTHYRNDLHQDHRVVCDLTWNTFRDHAILEYEIPKYDGDLGSPNLFVHIDEHIKTQKLQYILDCFKTQKQRHWFRAETFLSLMCLRGIESGRFSNYAEGFYSRKLVLSPSVENRVNLKK
jgi:LmbE family N-acetylglucosaminyl deacetylase